jgi:hypothetical protein
MQVVFAIDNIDFGFWILRMQSRGGFLRMCCTKQDFGFWIVRIAIVMEKRRAQIPLPLTLSIRKVVGWALPTI